MGKLDLKNLIFKRGMGRVEIPLSYASCETCVFTNSLVQYGSEDEWKPAVVNSPQPAQKRKTVKESGPNKR